MPSSLRSLVGSSDPLQSLLLKSSPCARWNPIRAQKHSPGMALQSQGRLACGSRCCLGPHPRSHCLFHHCGRGPQGGALCLVLHCSGNCLCWWQAGHDLRSHGSHGAADGWSSQGTWPAISPSRHTLDRPASNPCRRVAAWRAHAICFPLGHYRLRQCAGHPDFHGPAA